MSEEVLRALAQAGLDAQSIVVIAAGEAAAFTLILAVVIVVAIRTTDDKRREACLTIFEKLLEFLRDLLQWSKWSVIQKMHSRHGRSIGEELGLLDEDGRAVRKTVVAGQATAMS